MKKEEIKAKLDELEIEYDPEAKKEVLESLLDEADKKQTDLLDVVSKAVVKEAAQSETKKDNIVEELKSRPYGTLTRGQREVLRQNSPEYENVEGGMDVKLNDRVATEKRVVKDASGNWVSLFKGNTYSFSEQDYNLLKDAQVRVKTEATKDKCCGNAEYESISLLVKVDA